MSGKTYCLRVCSFGLPVEFGVPSIHVAGIVAFLSCPIFYYFIDHSLRHNLISREKRFEASEQKTPYCCCHCKRFMASCTLGVFVLLASSCLDYEPFLAPRNCPEQSGFGNVASLPSFGMFEVCCSIFDLGQRSNLYYSGLGQH